MKMLKVLFDENDLETFIEAIHFAEDEFKEHLEVMASSKMCKDEKAIFDIYANALIELENLKDNLYMTDEVQL